MKTQNKVASRIFFKSLGLAIGIHLLPFELSAQSQYRIQYSGQTPLQRLGLVYDIPGLPQWPASQDGDRWRGFRERYCYRTNSGWEELYYLLSEVTLDDKSKRLGLRRGLSNYSADSSQGGIFRHIGDELVRTQVIRCYDDENGSKIGMTIIRNGNSYVGFRRRPDSIFSVNIGPLLLLGDLTFWEYVESEYSLRKVKSSKISGNLVLDRDLNTLYFQMSIENPLLEYFFNTQDRNHPSKVHVVLKAKGPYCDGSIESNFDSKGKSNQDLISQLVKLENPPSFDGTGGRGCEFRLSQIYKEMADGTGEDGVFKGKEIGQRLGHISSRLAGGDLKLTNDKSRGVLYLPGVKSDVTGIVEEYRDGQWVVSEKSLKDLAANESQVEEKLSRLISLLKTYAYEVSATYNEKHKATCLQGSCTADAESALTKIVADVATKYREQITPLFRELKVDLMRLDVSAFFHLKQKLQSAYHLILRLEENLKSTASALPPADDIIQLPKPPETKLIKSSVCEYDPSSGSCK